MKNVFTQLANFHKINLFNREIFSRNKYDEYLTGLVIKKILSAKKNFTFNLLKLKRLNDIDAYTSLIEVLH